MAGVRPARRRCITCNGWEVFRFEGRRGPGSAGKPGDAGSGELNGRGECRTCEISETIRFGVLQQWMRALIDGRPAGPQPELPVSLARLPAGERAAWVHGETRRLAESH